MNSFQRCIPVRCSNITAADRKSAIYISIAFKHAGGTNGKELHLELTKDDDALFLYSLRMNEADFEKLKTEQNLLVDFINFPQMLQDLLAEVIAEDANNDPKYLTYFAEGSCAVAGTSYSNNVSATGSFEIVESNRFKHLVHISLSFIPASPDELRKHLGATFQGLKNASMKEKQLKSVETDLKRRLQKTEEALEQKKSEYEKLAEDSKRKLKALTDQHAKALSGCQEKLLREETNLKKKYDELVRQNRDLTEQVDNLSINRDRLDSANRQLEDECQQWQERYSQLERELDEIPLLRRDLENVERDFHAKDADLRKAHERVKLLLHEKKSLEEALTFQKSETDRGLRAIKQLLSMKQGDKEKAVYHGRMLVGQEKHVKELEESNEKLTKQVETMQTQLQSIKEENAKYKNELIELGEKLSSVQKDVVAKEALIQYMNRQLSDMKATSVPLTAKPPMMAPMRTSPNLIGHLQPITGYRPVLGLAALAGWKEELKTIGTSPRSPL